MAARTANGSRPFAVDWNRVWPFAASVFVVCAAFLLMSYRLRVAPDVFLDELLYFFVGKSISQGQIMREFWVGSSRVFFWQPPFFMLLEAPVIKFFNLASTDTLSAVYAIRYFDVAIAALTAGVLFLLVNRIGGFMAASLTSVLFALDPFVLRSARRNLLETAVIALVAIGVLLLSRCPDGLSRRLAVAIGAIFGLVLLTKEVAFFVLALPALFVLVGQPSQCRRLLPPLFGSALVSLFLYSLYPLWSFLSGNWPDFAAIKQLQLGRFSGIIRGGGWHRSSLSHAPSFVDALHQNLPQYLTSYALILVGGFLGLYLLTRSRDDVGARLLGCWALVTDVFFAFILFQGALEDQFFYLLLVPTAAVVGYSVSLLLKTRSIHRFLVFLPLALLLGRNVALYYSDYVMGIDNGQSQIHSFVLAHIPVGSSLDVASEGELYLYPGYSTYMIGDAKEAESHHIHYFEVSSKQAWGHYDGMTPEYYNWVTTHGKELFSVDEETSWHIGVYYLP